MSAKKKRRSCPAVGAEITSAQCGSERNTRHICPADCEFNPLAPNHYQDMLAIEEALDNACMTRLIKEDAEVDPSFWNAYRDNRLHLTKLHNGVLGKLFLERDGQDRSFLDRWEADRWEGLKNDARSVLKHKREARMGLLEVQHLPGPGRVQIIDLLRPAEPAFEVRDISLHGQAVRFQVLLCWYYELPHYHRICGNGSIFPTYGMMEPLDALKSISRHQGGPTDLVELAGWLNRNANTVEDVLVAVGTARQKQMLDSMDVSFGKAVYELNQPYGKCRRLLEENPQLDFDDLSDEEMDEGFAEARVWFEETADANPGFGRPVCGRILLGQANWRAEAMGEERFRRLRQLLETQMGDHLRFTGERLDDLGAQAAPNQDYDASLVPPELMDEPQKVVLQSGRGAEPVTEMNKTQASAQFRADYNLTLLDTPIPALDDKTPREAAQDSPLRPRLIRWAKNLVSNHDKQNLEAGLNADINWLLEELGLEEINHPAPPLRAAPPKFDDPEDRLRPPATDLELNVNPAPRLPPEPLTEEEAEARIRTVLDAFPTAASAFEELDRQASTIIDDLYVATDGLIEDDDFDRSITHLFHAWFSLVPPGCISPNFDRDELEAVLDSSLHEFENALRWPTPDKLEQVLNDHPQPTLTTLLCFGFLDTQQIAPPEAMVSKPAIPVALAMLTAVVAVLDEQLRD